MNSYIQAKSRGVRISLAVLLSVVLLLAVMLLTMPTVHAAEEDVTTWTACGTCEWGIDQDGCLWIRPTDGVSGTLADWGNNAPPWWGQRYSIKSVVVKHDVIAQTCKDMFRQLGACTTMDLSGLDTRNATNISGMFLGAMVLKPDIGQYGNLVYYWVITAEPTYSITFGPNCVFNGSNNAFQSAWCERDTFVHADPATGAVERMTVSEINAAASITPGTWIIEREAKSVAAVIGNAPSDQFYSWADEEREYAFRIPEGKTAYRATNASENNFVFLISESDGLYDVVETDNLIWEKVKLQNGQSEISGTLTSFGQFEIFRFEDPCYEVIYNANGGAGSVTNELFAVSSNATLSNDAPTKDGNICTGWNTAADGSGTHYDLGGVIPANTYEDGDEVILYAEWEILYSIEYNLNDGSETTERVDAAPSLPITITGQLNYNGANGKYLVGWNTSSDGSGTHYDIGQVIPANTFSEGDTLILYGEWADEPVSTDPSLLYVLVTTDISDLNSMGEIYALGEYDAENQYYQWADYLHNEQGTQNNGEYMINAPVFEGYKPVSVYRCTNVYAAFIEGSTEPTWELTDMSPNNISGTLAPYGQFKVLAVLYEEIDPNVTEFNATLLLDQNASVPDASIAFTASAGTGIAAVPGTSMAVLSPTAENGVTGAPTLGTAVFAPGDDTVTSVDGVTMTAEQKAVVKPVEIDFNGVTFAQPGVFRYIITEPSTGYGLDYDTQLGDETNGVRYQRVLDVYVQRVDDATEGTTSYQIAGFVLHEVADAPAEGAAAAADKSAGFVNEYDTKTVTLESRAAGNQSSIDKYFAYTITVQNPNNSVFTISADWNNAADALNPTANPATKYDVATITAANTAEWTSNADGSLSKTIYLRNGQKVELDGIPAGATYAISVADEDYSPSWAIGSDNGTTNATGNRVLNAMEDVVFTLTREGVVPTGVMLSAVPGLIIMAGALVVIIAMRKRKAEHTEA